VKLTSSRWVNRFVIALIVLTALVFVLQGLDHLLSRRFEAKEQEEQERRTTPRAQWVKAEPPDKSFSVLMPRHPVLLTNFVGTGKVPTIQLRCTDGGRPGEMEVYIAALTEFPATADLSDKEAIYSTAHAAFGDKLGRVRRDKIITWQGIAGREVEVELRNGTNLMVERAFITDGRLYQLTAAVPVTRGPTTNTFRFLDSFRWNTNQLNDGTAR
jgi:hypothetical protein